MSEWTWKLEFWKWGLTFITLGGFIEELKQELLEFSLAFHELLVRTLFRDASLLQHDDVVHLTQVAQSVRHQDSRLKTIRLTII